VKGERTATSIINKDDEKGIQIGLQGFMQAFIIQGKELDEALELAVEAHAKVKNKAREINSGITMLKHDPDTVAKVEQVFGEDSQSL